MKTQIVPETPDYNRGNPSPFGIVRFRKDNLQVISVNERAWEIMGIDGAEHSLRRRVAANLERIIPVAQQPSFAELRAAAERDGSIEFDVSLTIPQGRQVELACWLRLDSRVRNTGTYVMTIADVTQKRKRDREQRLSNRVGYLASQYDIVFLIESSERRARCLRYAGDEIFAHLKELRMALEDVGAYLAEHLAAPTFRPALRSFVCDATRPFEESEQGHRSLVFAAAETYGDTMQFEAVIVAAEHGDAFLCVRRLASTTRGIRSRLCFGEALDREAIVVMSCTAEEQQRVLFANREAKRLFGAESLNEEDMSPRLLLEAASFSPETAEDLMRSGCAEAARLNTGAIYRFSLESMPSSTDIHVLRALACSGDPSRPPLVSIRTFGYFDVFVDGKPIPFRSEKAKELLALLVDRRGGFVTSADAIATLWEHEPISERSRTRYRKVALHLRNTLAAYGADGIIESVRGKRRIVPAEVSCDLFEYLDHEPGSEHLFRGTYMSNYSWAEVTLSELVYG